MLARKTWSSKKGNWEWLITCMCSKDKPYTWITKGQVPFAHADAQRNKGLTGAFELQQATCKKWQLIYAHLRRHICTAYPKMNGLVDRRFS